MLYTFLQAEVAAVAAQPQLEFSLIDMACKGGWLMIPLLLLSIATIYLFSMKWSTIRKASKVDPAFMQQIKEYIETKYGYDLNRTWEYLNRTYDWDSSCQGTVPEAIIAFLESNDFEDAIRKAVSMGGDSDTLACITGGIAEAFYKEIPTHMIESTQKPFPPIFHKILDAIKHRTSYGKV
jgi:ADP-ribosylglycohydrolase